MKVKVLLASVFRETAGRKELEEEVPEGFKLADLLHELALRFQGAFNKVLTPSGEVNEDVLLFLNGMSLKKADLELKEGDLIMITSEVVGSR